MRLRYDEVYCELCRETIRAGELVAWWRVPGVGGRKRKAAYCSTCHSANIRAGRGRALR